jgi:hypothetical protein
VEERPAGRSSSESTMSSFLLRTAKSGKAVVALTLLGVLGMAGTALAKSDPPPPAPTITSAPPARTAATTATFSFTDTKAGVSFQCSLDGAAFASCTSPKAYTVAKGSHSFRVRAVSGSTTSSTVEFSWLVDPTPATPSITSRPGDPAPQTSASFSFTDSTPGVSFQCALDGGAYASCASPKSYSSLAQGPHTFRVKAVAGAYSSNPASYSWVVDTVPPPAPWILAQPSNPSRSSDASFLFIDAELDASYLCRLDGGAWDPCLVAKSYSRLSQGSHTFAVKARDAAGNVGSASSFTWTIDSIAPPKPVLTQKPSDPAPSNSGTFAWTDAEPGVSFQCRLDGDDWTSCTSPRTVTVTGNGTHQFAVRARDAAGNTSDAASYSWKVAQSVGFTVSGAPDGLLAPGVWRTLPLQIANPNNFTIYVTDLTVAVATSPAGCPASTNLELQQATVSSSQTVAVPANGTATVPAALRPRLRLKNLSVNQDACKSRSFGLTFSGSATK